MDRSSMHVTQHACLLDMADEILSHVTEYLHVALDVRNFAFILASARARTHRQPLWRQVAKLLQYACRMDEYSSDKSDTIQFMTLLKYVFHYATMTCDNVVLYIRTLSLFTYRNINIVLRDMTLLSQLPLLEDLYLDTTGFCLSAQSECPIDTVRLPLLQSLHASISNIPNLCTMCPNLTRVHLESMSVEHWCKFPLTLTSLTLDHFSLRTVTPNTPAVDLPRLKCFRVRKVFDDRNAHVCSTLLKTTMDFFAPFWNQLEELEFVITGVHYRPVPIALPSSLKMMYLPDIYDEYCEYDLTDEVVLEYDFSNVRHCTQMRIRLMPYSPSTRNDVLGVLNAIDQTYPYDTLDSDTLDEDTKNVILRLQQYRTVLREVLYLLQHFDQCDKMTVGMRIAANAMFSHFVTPMETTTLLVDLLRAEIAAYDKNTCAFGYLNLQDFNLSMPSQYTVNNVRQIADIFLATCRCMVVDMVRMLEQGARTMARLPLQLRAELHSSQFEFAPLW